MNTEARPRRGGRRGPRPREPRAGWRGAGLPVLALAAALAVCPAAASARPPSCEAAQRQRLHNGLEVVLLPDSSLPEVAIVSSVHAGFRDDPPGYAGLAHFVEHLTFRGAPAFASPFELYAEAGALDVNATTTADSTDYQAVLPAAQLERGLWIEARRLMLGLDLVSERSARDERSVVLREHELRHGHVPGLRLLSATYATLFPAPHPYHAFFPSEASLERLTLDAARRFFARHYRPEQVRLVVAGDFNPAAAFSAIERHFGGLARGPAELPGAGACERWARRAEPASSRLVLRSPGRHERLELYWPVLPEEEAEHGSRLFGLLRGSLSDAARQQGLASDVRAAFVRLELGSFWTLTLDIVPGQPLSRAEPLLRQVLAALGGSPPDRAELAAQSQAIELHQALAEARLLARARSLARRECRPSACSQGRPAPTSLDGVGRFDPSRALIVERRFDPDAPGEGEIERRP